MLFWLVVAYLTLTDIWNNFVNEFSSALPGVIGAIVIIVVGVIIGWGLGKLVNRIVDRTIEKHFDKSRIGQTFRSAGFDLSNFVGGLLYAFVVVLSVTLAIQMLNIQGEVGTVLVQVASYLPRLLGGIIVIVLGMFWSTFSLP
jgi:large-conductance mechanosensitive channel